MPQDITSFPFSEHQLHLLTSKGFHTVEDLNELSALELSEELGVTSDEALDILQVVTKHVSDAEDEESEAACDNGGEPRVSAYSLLLEEEAQTPVVTFCAALDDMIGGGVPPGKITEFCGTPGAGKTQIGIQLSVDVQIPEAFGGCDGEAVYIDCEGSFVPSRVVEIAEAALDHLANVAHAEDDELQSALKKISLESILSRIHVFRCHNYIQMVALSYTLPDFLQDHPKVKLIVLDSIAFHFRYDFDDMALRSRVLQGLVQRFMQMAHKNKLAVVFMNQMTTKVNSSGGVLVPALGQVWGHACTIRILLSVEDGQRVARLLKSPCHKEGSVPYVITKQGVRDVEPDPSPTDQSVDTNVNSLKKETANDSMMNVDAEEVAREKNDSLMQVVPQDEVPPNSSKKARLSS